jgi:quercetin dioxygenase-like cupin family protein
MKTLSEHRTVANIKDLEWVVLDQPGLPGEDVHWYNLSYNEALGEGSYLYKMGPGTRSNPHQHMGPEEFFILDGDLVDSDGHKYRAGDFVSLSGGSKHDSFSPSGCTIVVTHRGIVKNLNKEDL